MCGSAGNYLPPVMRAIILVLFISGCSLHVGVGRNVTQNEDFGVNGYTLGVVRGSAEITERIGLECGHVSRIDKYDYGMNVCSATFKVW